MIRWLLKLTNESVLFEIQIYIIIVDERFTRKRVDMIRLDIHRIEIEILTYADVSLCTIFKIVLLVLI